MRTRILAAALAVVASLGLAAAGSPAQAKPKPTITLKHHNVPAARTGGVSTLSVNPAYYYAGGQETTTQNLVSFNVFLPSVQTMDAGDHSVGEITVQNGSTSGAFRDMILEGGYVQQPGSGTVQLFASRWKFNTWAGSYVGSGDGWVDASGNPINLGQNLGNVSGVSHLGTAKAMNWQYSSANLCSGGPGWWFYYNGSAVGCYPDTVWTASPALSSAVYTTGGFFQAFGEVYDDDTTTGPCTNMGTGTMGSTKSVPAAYFASGAHGGTNTAMSWTVQSNPSWYTIGSVSGRTAYYGGPGAC